MYQYELIWKYQQNAQIYTCINIPIYTPLFSSSVCQMLCAPCQTTDNCLWDTYPNHLTDKTGPLTPPVPTPCLSVDSTSQKFENEKIIMVCQMSGTCLSDALHRLSDALCRLSDALHRLSDALAAALPAVGNCMTRSTKHLASAWRKRWCRWGACLNQNFGRKPWLPRYGDKSDIQWTALPVFKPGYLTANGSECCGGFRKCGRQLWMVPSKGRAYLINVIFANIAVIGLAWNSQGFSNKIRILLTSLTR